MIVTKSTPVGLIVIQIATLGILAGVTQYDLNSNRKTDCLKPNSKCSEVQIYTLGGEPLPDGQLILNHTHTPYRVSVFGETSFFNTDDTPTFSTTKVSHDPALYDAAEGAFETPSGIKYWRCTSLHAPSKKIGHTCG
jgi:hypothetical protein